MLTKAVVEQLEHGIWSLLRTPELYPWAVVSVVATMLQQSAFRAGTMAASLPAVAVSEPLVGSVLGIAVLGEMLRPGRSGWVSLGVAIAAMVISIVALARSEIVADPPGRATARDQAPPTPW